ANVTAWAYLLQLGWRKPGNGPQKRKTSHWTSSILKPRSHAIFIEESTMQPFVSFRDIGHTYETEQSQVTVLNKVNFEISKHEFVAIVGPSGCGKSTLLRLLSGLIQPTEGQIQVFGHMVSGPREDIGIVFQKPTLLPWKNVLDNVLFPLQHKFGHVSPKDRQLATELLEK